MIAAHVRLFAVVVSAFALVGCACSHRAGDASAGNELSIAADQMSAPARATLEKMTAGGRADKITKETEHGVLVYDVEATVNGQHVEYLIADADGKLLGTELPIAFSQLPEPVRMAAEKHFGTNQGLSAMKGEEYGRVQYEVEGMKDGKRAEVTFDPSGKAEP
jgi:uncharacterized membrane protein YkoI